MTFREAIESAKPDEYGNRRAVRRLPDREVIGTAYPYTDLSLPGPMHDWKLDDWEPETPLAGEAT